MICGLFLFSGATALVYETVWARSLTLIFGATHEAVSIVLAAFMAGLALGGFAFGRWCGRFRRPLRVYGLLELGIGVLALFVPWMLRLADRIYIEAALDAEGITGELQLLRVILTFVVLVLPTLLMGGTLPVLVSLLTTRSAEFGGRLSLLYAVNTAGAVIGTLTAGFVLLPRFGMLRTMLCAVAANLAIGALALVLDRFWARRAETGEAEIAAPKSPPPAEEQFESPFGATTHSGAYRLAFLGTAVVGMSALALEVFWMRGITIAVGNTAYSFAVMLASFLVGIALGSALHGLFPLRRIDASLQFGVVVVLIGLTSAVFSQLIPELPRLAIGLNRLLYTEASGVRAGATLLISFSIMLIPCILMGAAFPLAGEAGVRLRSDFGRSVGDLVGLNTMGAIVGALAAGFVLIPKLGLQRSMLLTSALLAGYGMVVIAEYLAARLPITPWILRSTAVAGVILALTGAFRMPLWDLHLLAIFRNNMMNAYIAEVGPLRLDEIAQRSNVVYYREGRGANVSVVDGPRARSLVIDGKSVATDGLSDMQHELLLGHVPVLLHPAPRSAVVIGLGAGITLGAVLAHGELTEVTVVEIEPAVVAGAEKFAYVNEDALNDPRLRVVFQDGRNYLLTSSERFDVITADPIHPWARGAAYLYTTEYYRLAGEHLTEDGVMCQWLPLYELSLENVRSAIATFSEVFPHTTVWQTANDAIMVGSRTPISIDGPALASRLRSPSVARQLAQIGLDDPLSFLAELALDRAGATRFSGDTVRNSDDNLYLEFSSPLSVARSEIDTITEEIAKESTTADVLLADKEGLVDEVEDLVTILRDYREAKQETIYEQRALKAAEGVGDPRAVDPIIARLETVVRRLPGYGRARSILSEAHVAQGMQFFFAGRSEDAVASLERAVEAWPMSAAANHHLATVLSESERYTDALPFFQAALQHRPRFATARLNYGVTLLRLGEYESAAAQIERAVAARPDDAGAHHMLAAAEAQIGNTEAALANFRRALELDPELPGFHFNFALFLMSEGRFDEALEIITAGLSVNPGEAELLRLESRLLSARVE